MPLTTCINCELYLIIFLFLRSSAFWTLSFWLLLYSFVELRFWQPSCEWPSKQWHMQMRTWQRSKSTAWKSLRGILDLCTVTSSHTSGDLDSHHSYYFSISYSCSVFSSSLLPLADQFKWNALDDLISLPPHLESCLESRKPSFPKWCTAKDCG